MVTMDPRIPAMELVAFYALCWKQEFTYHEFIEHLQGTLLLKSHTLL